MARRHVAEGEARVARQQALVADFETKGYDTSQALSLLGAMRHALRLMHEDLAYEQQRAARQQAK
jgi:hypothetical protein